MVSVRLILALMLLASAAFPGEARLLLPDPIPPGVAIDAVIEVDDAGKPVARLEFPVLEGVIWERLPGTEIQQVITNGSMRSSERLRLRVTVAKAGELAIPALTVHLRGGGSLTTAPRVATVRAGDARLIGTAVCWAEFIPSTAIVGQPVTLRFTCAFTANANQIETFGLAPPAQAKVLTSDDAPGETFGADGRRWRTLSKRWTLSFAEPGEVTVRGQQEYVPCEPFGTGFVMTGPRQRMPIPPATVRIRPMPAGGRPEGWNGLVAPVTVAASLDRERLAVGEGARLTIRVRGAQAGLLVRPALDPIDGVSARGRDEAGERSDDERTFTWDLQPAAAGTYQVVSPAVAYFDPAIDAFRAMRGERLTLRVEAGSATPVTVVGGAPAAVAVPATTALALPLPRHGDAARAWSPTALAAALALAGLATAVVGIAARWPRRTRRAHRGRALAAAMRAGDHTAAARAASALRADLPPHLVAVADAFDAELAAIRFGGASAERLAGLAAQLETLP